MAVFASVRVGTNVRRLQRHDQYHRPTQYEGKPHRNIASVLVQDTTRLTDLLQARALRLLLAACPLLVIDEPVDLACLCIDDDPVAVLD